MTLDILKYPDPRLAQPSEAVETVTDDIRKLAQDMLETMYAAEGVGLAAPQVGKLIRLIVMDPWLREGEKQPMVFINPEVEPTGDTIISTSEGCLSVPLNFRADVPRYSSVRVRGLDLNGNPIETKLDGFAAIIIQHETDHLNGTLFIDRISRLRRNMYDTKVKKWQKSHG